MGDTTVAKWNKNTAPKAKTDAFFREKAILLIAVRIL